MSRNNLLDSDNDDSLRDFAHPSMSHQVDSHLAKRSKKDEQSLGQVVERNIPKTSKVPNLVEPQTIVTINVTNDSDGNPSSQPFRAHKNYICHYSAYFDAAFNGNFSEGISQELNLPDVEPDIFGMFVNWTYSQMIVNEEGALPAGKELARLWVLADRIIAPKLANDTILGLDKQRIENGGRLSSGFFEYVYENTNDKSPLRLYVIDACSKGTLGLIKNGRKYPHQLLLDIINAGRIQDKSSLRYMGVWRPSQSDLRDYFVSETDAKR